jgi:hypothetical protein
MCGASRLGLLDSVLGACADVGDVMAWHQLALRLKRQAGLAHLAYAWSRKCASFSIVLLNDMNVNN